MNDWLKVMLEEIARKKREVREAEVERERRAGSEDDDPGDPPDQSK